MLFYLGANHVSWLAIPDAPPLFVSARAFRMPTTPTNPDGNRYRKKMPRATGRWALDSGGFTELSRYGTWTTGPTDYIHLTRRLVDEVGGLDWAAPQDWMCEPWIVAKTGLSVEEHQRRTIDNFLELSTNAPDLPYIPVLQGWVLDDYRRHATQYLEAGVDLAECKVVGLGSVCRRQATSQIGEIVTALTTEYKMNLHGFGVKKDGIRGYGWLLSSADSMAWSVAGAYQSCSHSSKRKSCGNCYPHALEWRNQVLTQVGWGI